MAQGLCLCLARRPGLSPAETPTAGDGEALAASMFFFSLLGEHFRDFDPVFADAPVGLHAIRLQEGRIPWQVALPVPRSNERLAVATTAL